MSRAVLEKPTTCQLPWVGGPISDGRQLLLVRRTETDQSGKLGGLRMPLTLGIPLQDEWSTELGVCGGGN